MPSSLKNSCIQPGRLPVHAPNGCFDRNCPLIKAPLPEPLASPLAVTQASLSTAPSHHCEPVTPGQGTFHDTYTLTLAGGYELKYSEADFQDIPLTSGIFSDASCLATVWDDASPLWGKEEYSPLIVQNILIVMKYWKQFYQKFQKVEHQNCWNNWHQNWYNYQVQVRCLNSQIWWT